MFQEVFLILKHLRMLHPHLVVQPKESLNNKYLVIDLTLLHIFHDLVQSQLPQDIFLKPHSLTWQHECQICVLHKLQKLQLLDHHYDPQLQGFLLIQVDLLIPQKQRRHPYQHAKYWNLNHPQLVLYEEVLRFGDES